MKKSLVKFCLLAAICCNFVASVSVTDRPSCKDKEIWTKTRVNTTTRLGDFRNALANITVNSKSLSAFIVTSGDAHNSEYPSKHDKRREYISGFEGSAGTAVITSNHAALWTDGRYFLEAEETLDCNWILMKSGEPGVPTVSVWLDSVLTSGDYVGVDNALITHSSFTSLFASLENLPKRLELKEVNSSSNPVDAVWRDQPPPPNETINALELKFAGVSWQDKVNNLKANISSHEAQAFVVTDLDEIAWLFNLRGTDVDYTPFFLAYAVVELSQVRLYIRDKDRRLNANPTDRETHTKLYNHLNTGHNGSCNGIIGPCVEIVDYNLEQLERDLATLAQSMKILITSSANYAIYKAVMTNVRVVYSPIQTDKSVKNPTEIIGMNNAYKRDSAELVKFLAFLDNEIKSGKEWTEVSAAEKLADQRRTLEHNRGLSFETIAGYGPNGAVIHYRPLPATDRKITTDNFFLLDSGGQYLDGTTDVTRTMHYGTPTVYEKECYTRVLMSSINLAMIKWPEGLRGRILDTVARNQLWEVGLDFRHGTGHGIGAYLSVHEGPGNINILSTSSSETPLRPHEYYSNEPGYYEDGHFGIRLETVVTVVEYKPKYNKMGGNYLQFEPVALVPFEPSLVNFSLMNLQQVEWLNSYNAKIRKEILPLIASDPLATNWVNQRTRELHYFEVTGINSCGRINISVFVFFIVHYCARILF